MSDRQGAQGVAGRHLWIDGRLEPADGRHLSAFDRGFQLGDGVFETLRARGGRPTELAEHLARLRRSAEGLDIELGATLEADIERGMAALLDADGLGGPSGDASVRITVSRGAIFGRGLLPAEAATPTIAIQAWPVPPTPVDHLERGLHLVTSGVRRDPASPLAYYLSITPSDVAVPELLGRADALPRGRRATSEVVAFVHPEAGKPGGQLRSSCSSATDFVNAHCSLIEDWIEDGLDADAFGDWSSWCSSGLLAGDAQRTGSSQGVPNPHEARIRVAGCSDDVLVRRYYRNPFSGAWWNAGNYTVQPGFAMSWKIFWYNARWCEGEGDLEFCTGASDMRFRVEPTPGATYRYTGGFVTPTPVP